jgi:YqaJ-like recombinase protein
MKVFDFEQYSADWWSIRRGVPTSSCADQLITPSKGEPSKSAVGYAHQLIADTFDGDYGVVSEFATAAMRNGSVKEPESRRYYEFERDCEVREVGFCLDDAGQFGCSPDSLVGDDGLLELKNPNAKTHVSYLLKGGLPDDYKPQCHFQLIVTGRAWCDFMSYRAGFPKLLVRVEPDAFTEKLRAAMREFWPMYQGLLAKITADRNDTIAETIDRKGDQLPENLRGLVPASQQYVQEF